MKLVFGFCRERFYYTEGVKSLITPYEMRNKGKVANRYRNPRRVELYAAKSIIGEVLSVVLKSENRFQFGITLIFCSLFDTFCQKPNLFVQ